MSDPSDLSAARRRAEVLWARDKASQALGMSFDIERVGAATVRMAVRDDMLNGLDVCHGGILFTLADTAFAYACHAYEQPSIAASASIDFLRPTALGDQLCAMASEEYRGRKNGYYTVRISNQKDELVALFRGRSTSPGASTVTV